MNDHLGLSRREVGAGLAAAGSAYVAASLFVIFDLLSGSGSRGSPAVTLGMVVTPVVALLVATVIWRVAMPEEPNPRNGAVAGAFSGAVSVLVFTAPVTSSPA
jgi:chromate transport protein ChrA